MFGQRKWDEEKQNKNEGSRRQNLEKLLRKC